LGDGFRRFIACGGHDEGDAAARNSHRRVVNGTACSGQQWCGESGIASLDALDFQESF
jgi:hypothetical protein